MNNKDNSYRKRISVKMSLNYLYWVVFLMVSISSLFYYFDGYFGGDLEGVGYPVDEFGLIIFTAIYLFGLAGSLWLSKKLIKLKLSQYVLVARSRTLLYLFFMFFSLLILFLAISGGVGTIHRDVETNRYVELFFAFFDPYILMIVMIYFMFYNMNSERLEKLLFFCLISIYIFLVVRSGFTGFLMLLLPIFIGALLRFLSKSVVIVLLVLSVLLFPFIRIGKWIVGSGIENFSDDFFSVEIIQIATRGVIERFSAVPNMVYINESLINKSEFLQSNYLPFFQGYIGSFFHKLFFSSPVALNTLLLHQTMQNTNTDSNSTFPIVSYFSLDVFLGIITLLYISILVFIISRLLLLIFGKTKLGNGLALYFLFFVVFFYAFNGWLWAVWGVIQALLVFVFVLMLFGKLSRVS